MKKTVAFLFTWLMVGFASGTAVLVGPVGWITGYGRRQGWSPSVEDNVVLGIIVAYVVASALASWWLASIALRTAHRHVRVGIPVLVVLAAGACLWLWLSPELMVASVGSETAEGSSFTFGPYPTEARMKRLRAEGYTAVLSLLHPAVVPFETRLISEGREAAERAGLDYVHVPMLPWVDDNWEAVEKIEDIARSGRGRYYVHCYLGKDRVRLVQRIVAQAEPEARLEETADLAEHRRRRSLREVEAFERGRVIEAAEGVYLTPYPTDDEYMSYILPGTHGPVVSLLDPDNPDDVPWIDKEKSLLESHRLDFHLRPVSLDRHDPARVLEVAREVARMERPVVVHAFLGLDSGRSPATEAFLQAFRSNRPPLPPSLFAAPMGGARVTVVAPNVAVGPSPRGRDLGAYLWPRGIREIVYLGDPEAEEAKQERRTCDDVGLGWRAMRPDDPALIETLSSGGPWYVHGEAAERLGVRIAQAMGPAVPETMQWKPVNGTDVAGAKPGGEADRVGAFFAFVRRMVPGVKTVILLGPFCVGVTALAAALAGWLRSRRGVSAPYTRKTFHFVIFTLAAVLHLAGGLPVVALFGGVVACAVVYAVWRGEGFPFYEAMARPSDKPRQTLFVLVPLATTAIGGIAANFFFGTVAFVGYLVAGWGDAIGEPVGTAWGRHRYRVPSIAGVFATRSLEGSAAVVVMGFLAALAGLTLSGVALPTALVVAAACATAGALVEAVSNHGLDNLTVQLAASGTAFLILQWIQL